MHHHRCLISAWVALCCVTAGTAWAQSSLWGVVYDPAGDTVAGATVVVTNETTGATATRTTNRSGLFFVRDLPAGPYVTSVRMPPYQPASDRIVLPPYEKRWQFFDLQLASAEEITVPSDSPQALLGRDGSVGTAFSREQIEAQVFSNGRTIQSFVSAVPGIVFTESTDSLAQFTTVGQRRLSNALTIDGMNADLAVDVRGAGIGEAGGGALPATATTGGTQTLVPLEAIEEIQVRTTNASSAQARTPGAQTAIITRAGTDRFTGSAFADLRPAALTARDWFNHQNGTPKRRVVQWTNGLAFGGPLIRRRLFSFVAWERQRIDRPLAATALVPSMSVRESAPVSLRPALDAFPRPNGRELSGGRAEYSHLFPAASELSTVSVRLDATLSTQHRAFGRFNRGHSEGDGVGALRQQPSLAFESRESTKTTSLTTGLSSVYGTVLHDLRLNATRHRAAAWAGAARHGGAQPLPTTLFAPDGVLTVDAWVRLNLFPGAFVINGLIGASSQEQMQVASNWTLTRGRHEWRAGFDYLQVLSTSSPPPIRYTYNFGSLTDLLKGQVRSLAIEQALPAQVRRHAWAGFMEGRSRLSSRLSIGYGLRYDVRPAPRSTDTVQPLLFEAEALPALAPRPIGSRLWSTTWTNIAPRITASYQLATVQHREIRIRAGWQRSFDALPVGTVAFGRAFPYVATGMVTQVSFPVAADLRRPIAPVSFGASLAAEAYAFPQKLRTPRVDEWHVGLDQALGVDHRLALAYVGAVGRDQTYRFTQYLDASHPVHGISNHGASSYHGLLVEASRRLSRGLQARLAYTWSHAIDLDSGETSGPILPPSVGPPHVNRGDADFDRRHVLRAAATVRFPAGVGPKLVRRAFDEWQIDIVGLVISGAPVSVTFVQDFGNGTPYVVRPDVRPGVPVWIDDATSPTGRRINRDAFDLPTEARQGNLGRNTLTASPLRQVDIALSRSFRVGSRATAQFRLEAFNVFDIDNFAPPRGALNTTDFGRPIGTYAEGLGSGSLGGGGGLPPAQQSGGPRACQLGVRLRW